MSSWFSGAAAPPPSRMEKHFLVNENNETPYGYFLHRRTGQHSRTGFFHTPPDEILKLETFNRYLSQSTIAEYNAKNHEDEKYIYAIEPLDKYNLFKMTGEPNPPSFPRITYDELIRHYDPDEEANPDEEARGRHGGKVRKSSRMVRKSRRMTRKSRKGQKRIFTH